MPNPFLVSGTADSFSFNGPIREIEVGAGTSTFDMQKVYSFWKQWVLEGNAQYLPAFRPVGGDELGGDNKVAFYLFLSNNWRVRLPEGIDDLFVTGGILSTDELDNPFRFDGALVVLQQPVSVQFVSSLQTEQIIDDVARFRELAEFVIAPEIYYMRNTIEKTIAPSVLSVVSPVTNLEYDKNTGITTVTTEIADHHIEVGDRIHLVGVAMTCVEDGGDTLVLFPDIELGSGVYPNPGDISQPYVFVCTGVPALNKFTINVGISTFTHVYTYGGVVSRYQTDLINNQFGLPVNEIPPRTSDPTVLEKIEDLNTQLIGVGTDIQTSLTEIVTLNNTLVGIGTSIQLDITSVHHHLDDQDLVLADHTASLTIINNNTKLIPGII